MLFRSFIICPASKVLQYLNSPFLFMNDEGLQDIILDRISSRPRNNESFQRIIAEFYEWQVVEMDINGFISADSLNEKTTWGEITKCNESGLFYKYRAMYENALSNFEAYNKTALWVKVGNQIKIS